MACVAACPTGAVRIDESPERCRPVVDEARCISCGKCERTCQALHLPDLRSPMSWTQGWAVDPEERASSSSGGFASAIARGFIERGGVVVSCALRDGVFGFEAAENSDDLGKFKGSKYVKSDATRAYPLVLLHLKAGRRVLFIGLPCQAAALRTVVGEDLARNLYTVDLICHGTPARVLLEDFLGQKGLSLDACSMVDFRRKRATRLRERECRLDAAGVIDRFLIAFLDSLIYTENCYSCPYARLERVSDLTLGDSWGTDLVDELPDGVSLALVMSAKGDELLDGARIERRDVDLANAIAHNGQLREPSAMPAVRGRFFGSMAKGRSFDRCVAWCYPKACVKQSIKRVLVRLGLYKPSAGVQWGVSVTVKPTRR